MTAPLGFNPMRWRCEDPGRGCYNIKHRPKIELFAECLPGRIAFTDVDATVEVSSHFLFLEFKSAKMDLPTGQRIYFQRLTSLSSNITVVVVAAEAETMVVQATCVIAGGRMSPWEETDLQGLKDRIAKWATKAQQAGSSVPSPGRFTRAPWWMGGAPAEGNTP